VNRPTDIELMDGPPMNSVDNALRILMLLWQRPSVRVSEVAGHLGVSVSTAHRLLSSLVYRDLAEQDPATREYRSGAALRARSDGAGGINLIGLTRPYLDLLSRELGETIQLLVLQGQNVKFIGASESTRSLRTSSRVGVTLPAHTASGGKVLLAELSPPDFRALYRSKRLPARTPDSITSREDLEVILAKVRRAGYATSIGEGEPDVSAVAVAVRDQSGQAHAAIAASGPRVRMPRRHMADMAERLSWAAHQISGAL
jgi:DNA-binding IclR family transcriptional regulator